MFWTNDGAYTPMDMNNAVVSPTIISVKNQPRIDLPITILFIPVHFLISSNAATPIVPPIWQCVVDKGIPSRLPIIITVAVPNSIANPRDGVILHILHQLL